MHISALTDFVIRHLDTIAKREGFLSYEYKHEAGAKPDDGSMATVLAIELHGPRRTLDDSSNNGIVQTDTFSLMCKLLPDNIQRQQVFRSRSLFEREIHFYAQLQPYLERFQLDKGLTPETGFFSSVQCFVAIADATTDEYE